MAGRDWQELWLRQARADYDWLVADRPALADRVDALIDDIRRRPFSGLGKPEPLRGNLAGWWSRRIDREHRLVYRVSGSNPRRLEITQCRYLY